MAQVSHRTLMQLPFMGMAVRPNALLSKCALGIKKIWMSLKLDVAGLAQPLLMGVMISPRQEIQQKTSGDAPAHSRCSQPEGNEERLSWCKASFRRHYSVAVDTKFASASHFLPE